MRLLIKRLVVLTLTLVSCFSMIAFSEEVASGYVPEDIILKSVNCSSGPYELRLPLTIEGFRALGKRRKEQIQAASDYTGDPSTHTSGNFWYDGMYLGVVFENENPRGSFLEGALISNARWNRLSPIKVGFPVREFLSKEKLPDISIKTTLLRVCSSDEGAPDCIELTLKKGIVTDIAYFCYTG